MNKKVWRRVVRTVLLTLVGLIVGVRLYQWNASSLAGNQLPMPLGVGTAVVMSGSMEPVLSTNDLIIITKADSYQEGDIVVYQSANSLVVHRIVDIQGDMVTTKGDANNTQDEPFRNVYIKGKLWLAIPGVGMLTRIVKSLPGTILILGGALLLMERSFRREKQEDQESIEKLKEEIRKLKEDTNESEKGA